MIKRDEVYIRSRQRGLMNSAEFRQHYNLVTITSASDIAMLDSDDFVLKNRLLNYLKDFKEYSFVAETGMIFAAIGRRDGKLQTQASPLYVEIMTRD